LSTTLSLSHPPKIGNNLPSSANNLILNQASNENISTLMFVVCEMNFASKGSLSLYCCHSRPLVQCKITADKLHGKDAKKCALQYFMLGNKKKRSANHRYCIFFKILKQPCQLLSELRVDKTKKIRYRKLNSILKEKRRSGSDLPNQL
jgi:hypothetical protein